MAYSQTPDKVKVYTTSNKGIYFVVNQYLDIPELRNWYYQDKDSIRDDIGTGTDTPEHINNIIKAENMTLYKELNNKWFNIIACDRCGQDKGDISHWTVNRQEFNWCLSCSLAVFPD